MNTSQEPIANMSHSTQPTLINLPQPPSNPETPSEMPGTPTSTTTSLSALSTTAIKDGHRGHALATTSHRGHAHHASTNSLEAERADRISRLAGLSGVNTLRPSHHGGGGGVPHGHSQQTTPTTSGFPAPATAPAAYFDNNGQPTAATKISTVGSASATESLGGRTTLGDGGDLGDEDMLSMDTNYGRETELDSASGYLPSGGGGIAGDMDAMDEDIASGGYEDRMSDDGEASLVGFGEGAGSTVSGPIYHRRPLPTGSSAGAMAGVWGLERTSSGLSDVAVAGGGGRRDLARGGEGGETPVSISAAMERRDARMVDGVATDGAGVVPAPDDDMFVDTTTRGPVPVMGPVQPTTSALRVTQQPNSFQQQQQQAQQGAAASREALERIVRGLDDGEARAGNTALGSPENGGERLGKFYFEDKQ